MARHASTPSTAPKGRQPLVAPDDWLSRALTRTPGLRGGVLKARRSAFDVTGRELCRHIQARKPGRFGEARLLSQSTLSAIESEEIPMPRGFVRVYVQAVAAVLRERAMLSALERPAA